MTFPSTSSLAQYGSPSESVALHKRSPQRGQPASKRHGGVLLFARNESTAEKADPGIA
jgi:hypothetical protein